jgi:hypothetical protein
MEGLYIRVPYRTIFWGISLKPLSGQWPSADPGSRCLHGSAPGRGWDVLLPYRYWNKNTRFQNQGFRLKPHIWYLPLPFCLVLWLCLFLMFFVLIRKHLNASVWMFEGCVGLGSVVLACRPFVPSDPSIEPKSWRRWGCWGEVQ